MPDLNGAGIRLEQGDLTVAQTWFPDSQQGILTGDDAEGTIVIDKIDLLRPRQLRGPLRLRAFGLCRQVRRA